MRWSGMGWDGMGWDGENNVIIVMDYRIAAFFPLNLLVSYFATIHYITLVWGARPQGNQRESEKENNMSQG